MENEWCKPGGHRYFPEIDPVIPRLRRLLDQCRSNGTQVIYVHSLRYPNSDEFVRFGQEPFIIKGTWGATYTEELTPMKGEPVVEKNTHDAFFQTEMDNTLKRLNILRPRTTSSVPASPSTSVSITQSWDPSAALQHRRADGLLRRTSRYPCLCRAAVRRSCLQLEHHMTRLDMLTFQGQQAAVDRPGGVAPARNRRRVSL